MENLVSIVIPIYNVEKYLDRCINSIVSQTYKNLEIILVDDGSSDNCPQMCDAWAEKDNRIKVIHKQNAGLGMARNSGMEIATGKYVLFVDSDDYIDVCSVQKSVFVASKNEPQIVMFGHNDFDDYGKIKPLKIKSDKLNFEGKDLLEDLLPGLFAYDRGLGVRTGNKMFLLDLLKSNNIFFKSEREIISEDAFFLLEVFKFVKKVSILPENLYYYYRNANSLTSTYKEDRPEKNKQFLLKCMEICDINNYPECVKIALKARYHLYMFSALKHIVSADIRYKYKKSKLKAIYEDKVLQSTLTDEVLCLEIERLQYFWRFLRNKKYNLCTIILFLKTKF